MGCVAQRLEDIGKEFSDLSAVVNDKYLFP
jgi:hypothetical protein